MRFEPHDRNADIEALRQLASWCQRFSPHVALEEAHAPESLFLDITGCAHLFGGEEEMVRQIVVDLREHGCHARAAAADTIGAAWALTTACGLAQPNPNGRAKPQAMASLPVAALRLPAATLELLRVFDIRRIDQLLALPRADLTSRFGPELVRRLDQALGAAPELLTPQRDHEVIEAFWEFDPPTADRRAIETVLDHLLDQILHRLRQRHLGVQKLLCLLRTSMKEPLQVPVGLLQPSASVGRLMELLRLHLERLRVTAEVSAVSLRIIQAAPLEFEQAQLFETDAGAERWKHFPALIERLSHRLGEKAVLRPRLWPDAQPELAFRCAPWLLACGLARPNQVNRAKPQAMALRPSRLLRPTDVGVMSLFPEGPPLRLEWQDHSRRIAQYWGPERIETGWWRDRDVRRDYYLVETDDGERFWLFRLRDDSRWFLHGMFG